MKIRIFLMLAICIICFATQNIRAQEPATGKIAILPFQSIGVEENHMRIVESILRVEISKLNDNQIISEKITRNALAKNECFDSECALVIGERLGASKVLGGKLAALGEKIITQYYLIDISKGKEVLIDQITASNIEDLENVMKRIAISVVNLKSISGSAEVGAITEAESKKSFRRTSNKNFGISFGYLYPIKGYDDVNKSFVIDLKFDYELNDYAIGMLLGIHKGFSANIYSSYLFTKDDICPYIGGGLGFHWVAHDQLFGYNNSSDVGYNNGRHDGNKDGFELVANAGVRLFHTYNFQIVLNLEYSLTFNDYDDRAIIFTIGLL